MAIRISRALTFLLLFCAAFARGQMIPPQTIDSIDVRVLQAHNLVVGKVADVKTVPEKEKGRYEITIAVDETLKGPPGKSLKLQVWAAGEGLYQWFDWKEKRTSLLVDVPSREQNLWTSRALPLNGPIRQMTADLKAIRDREALLKYIRELVKRRRGVEHVEVFRYMPPRPPEGKPQGDLALIPKDGIVVPVDERLEREALEGIRSPEIHSRMEGVRSLRYFKTPANIARLKALLKDPGFQAFPAAEQNRGVESRRYVVREEAYRVLTDEWKLAVPKPVLEETVDVIATVDSLRFDGNYQEGNLEAIGRAKGLKKLDISTYAAWPANYLDVIAASKELTELRLPTYGISDEGLAGLAALPKLRRLWIDRNPITDAGLRELAKWKNLEEVGLTQTDVTDEGLAELRRTRPKLIGVPERAGNPLSLFIRVQDFDRARATLDREPKWVNEPTGYLIGGYPLHGAAYERQYEMTKLLLQRGADPNVLSGGENALQAAMVYYEPDLRIIELLLARGVDLERPNKEGLSPLVKAAQMSNTGLVRLLLAAGADPFSFKPSSLGLAKPRQETLDLIEAFTQQRLHPTPILPRTGALCERVVYSLNPPDGGLPGWKTETHGNLTGPLGWSRTPSGRPYIGPFGQQSATLEVEQLPEHRNVMVEMDLFVMGSWDGNGGLVYEPDLFEIRVPGLGTLLRSTFFNNDEEDAAGLPMQSFPDPYPLGAHPGYAGATEVRTLGTTHVWNGREYRRDAVYRLSFTFAHSDPKLSLVLDGLCRDEGEGSLAEAESWGVGRLVVKAD